MLQIADVLIFVFTPLVSSLALAVMHWFPWNNGTARPGRILAYALGAGVVVGIPALAMLLVAALGLGYRELFWAALLVVNTGVSGATVYVAYWIDERRALTLDDAYAARRE